MTLKSKGILRHKAGKSGTQQSCGHRLTRGCLRGHPDPYTERTRNWFWGGTEYPARSDPRDIQSFVNQETAAKGLRARALESDYWDLDPSSTLTSLPTRAIILLLCLRFLVCKWECQYLTHGMNENEMNSVWHIESTQCYCYYHCCC